MVPTDAFLEHLIYGLPDSALILDAEFRLLSYNESFLQLVGLSRRELARAIKAGQDVFAFLSSPEGKDRELLEQCRSSRRPLRIAEISLTNAARRRIVVWLSVIPVINSQGELSSLVEIIRDVSSEVRIHDRFKHLLALKEAYAHQQERLVAQRTSELTKALEEVTRLSRTDHLTGLLNRRAFSEIADYTLDLSRRHRRQAAVIMCDLDYFKSVNDTYGHRAGDMILSACANCLRYSVRKSDVVGRFGGEEFVILIPEAKTKYVRELAERCRQNVTQLPVAELVPKMGGCQTASFGIAIFPQHGQNFDELVVSADIALYQAKETGRNRCVIYQEGIEESPAVRGQPVEVLVVGVAGAERQKYLSGLSSDYQVRFLEAAAGDLDYFLANLNCQVVIVSWLGLKADGRAQLERFRDGRPDVLRVVVLDGDEPFAVEKSADLGLFDLFVLDEEFGGISKAIEDSMSRRGYTHGQGITVVKPRAAANRPEQFLNNVISNEEYCVAYQPIVRADDKSVFGYESLCRFKTYSISLSSFFDAAVRYGKIWQLGHRLRESAIGILDSIPEECLLFLNIHPAELSEPAFLEKEVAILNHSNRVVLEITERASIGNIYELKEKIWRLADFGFRFAIDDLGAGYASLNSVALLSPHFIKVDMEIIRNIDVYPTKRRLLRRIIDFANDENIKVVAEGVETKAELETLTEIGCHLLQGFFVGAPRRSTDVLSSISQTALSLSG